MPKHAVIQFRREIDNLFHRRSHWLKSVVGRKQRGAAPTLERHHISKTIERCQDLASEALAERLARTEFEQGVHGRRSWHAKKGKGRGPDAKRRSFDAWFDRYLGPGMYIYAFWRRRHCVYVGKTAHSGRRVSSHFVKHWFGGVTRVDVYEVRGRRYLPALECLAIHRFQPTRNKFKAEKRKWTRKCQLCKVHRQIREELNSIFRLR